MRAAITGVGHYLPEQRLTNADIEKMVDTNDEWIITRTGIRERRILGKGLGTSYMAIKAGEKILAQRNISPDELDLIILATVTPDMMVPSAVALVQKELKAGNCWGFDLNGGCSGFLCALAAGSQFIETGKYKKVMVLGADKMSAIIDYTDRNTCVIFGDGAGGVLLEPADESDTGIEDFQLHLNGEGAEFLHVEGGGSLNPASPETLDKRMHYVYQDGKAVFKKAITGMADVSLKILKHNNLESEQLKLLIPHQANYRIIDAVGKKLGLDGDKVIINLEKYGNTTAATIPIAMSESYEQNRMAKGDWLLLSAFGAGFTWGSILLRWAMDCRNDKPG